MRLVDKNNFFDVNYYIELLQNKNTICIKDFNKYESGILVRHDVDYSLSMAYEFSRYEKKYNIKSTYYILLSTDLYNVFSTNSQKQITQMLEDGFEIGLHFDPTVYGDLSEEQLLDKMEIEINIFEEFYRTKIYSYSMHNPSTNGIYLNYPSLINAYDSKIFSDKNYISDSSYSFRGKNPREFLSKSKNELIQFLTHPIHFFGDGKISYEKQLNSILNCYYNYLDELWSVNAVYKNTKKEYNIDIAK